MKPLSLIAALSVALAFASPAVAGTLPLRGTLAAVEIDDVQFPVMYVSGSGTGQSTMLGRYTMTFTATVDLGGPPPPAPAPGIGSLELVAANGDKISATFTGLGTFINATTASVVEIATITGGTGRFAGASGTFTIQRLVDLTTGLSTGSFSGTVSSPGAN